MSRNFFCATPLLLVFGAAAWGFTSKEIRKFEAKAAQDIAAQLQGEQKSVRVNTKPNGPFGPLFADISTATIRAERFSTEQLPLFTEPERSKSGRIGSLNIQLRDFSIKGLRIEALNSSIPECRFDRRLAERERQIRLSQSGIGNGEVIILEDDLEPYILKTVREIKKIDVQIERGKVWLEGYGEFLIAKTEFFVVADLVSPDGTSIELANARVLFGWQKADNLAKKVLLDALNPVVDLKKDLGLLDAFSITKMTLSNGKLVAQGRTKIPERPAEGR